jgi:hypothetical protein
MSDESSPESPTPPDGPASSGPPTAPAPRSAPAPADRPSPTGTRASDDDRERLVSELNEHTVAGRLGTDELESRTQAAYQARTTAELDALRKDLPATKSQIARTHAERRSHLSRRMVQETGGSVILFVVCTAVWLVSGASGQFWPAWVLLIVLVSVARNAWALYGPGADLDELERRLDQRQDRHRDRGHRRHDRRHR